MKNNYLHNFQRDPNPEFTNTLYQHLSTLPQTAPTPHPASRPKIRLAWIMATILLMLSVMAMVPSVRTRFKEMVRRIGGLTILITDQYPDSENARIVPNDVLTLAEARARVDYEFGLPTWLPDEFSLKEDEIIASNIRTSLTLQWVNTNVRGRAFSLHVSKALPGANYVVGPTV